MDADSITAAVRLAGLDQLSLSAAEVVGDDPVLTSPHRLGRAAAVANVLVGDAARRLWRARTGEDLPLRVDLAQAAYGLQSFLRLRFGDPERAPELQRPGSATLTGLHPTADGRYVQLHQSFGDGPAVLGVLGLRGDPSADALAAAVLRWDALDLETALTEAGLCGGMVRTRDEWDRHPQGRVLAPLPVVTVERIGDGPPTAPAGRAGPANRDGEQAASGVRVLDATRVLAGPTVARTLAEHGADVLHVTGPRLPTVEWFDVDTGFGKRQASLDLDRSEELDVLRALLAGADVFVQSYRPGALARRGLGAEQLAATCPGVVVVDVSCYGSVGPWSFRPGWEQLAQAATGISEREGRDTGVPRLVPAAACDYTTGMFAAFGAMEALLRRAAEGGSWRVEVSLCRTAMWLGDLGTVPDDRWPTAHESAPAPRTEDVRSPDYGPLTRVAGAVDLGPLRVGSDRPPVRAGHHRPVWATSGSPEAA